MPYAIDLMMEDNMANTLKSLTFTTMPQVTVNPVIDRRNRIIERLEEQKQLLGNPKYMRIVKERVNKDGVKTIVEKQQKVQPWWRAASNGTYAFGIRAGKLIEFEKGRTAVTAPSLDKLPAVIDTLIAAVKAGELDAQLESASKSIGARKAKKAA
jgi:hypothetical protein